jgi:hypothetical protein
MENKPGTITLMGSGELADSMAKVHRAILARVEPDIHAVFVDTPAGFELNVEQTSERAVEYFQKRFNVTLQVASFRSKSRATALEVEGALRWLRHANFIFAGPGSPSYAIKNWRGSAVWDTIVARFAQGAHLVFASAATIGMGCCSLPVYEIYKAGGEVDWMDGLDLLGPLGLKLAIVPHWNNAEGETYDTRYCYMGEPRLRILEDKLPFDGVIFGIDEHTAITLDPSAHRCIVSGVGSVTLRSHGKENSFPAGSTFSFDQLRVSSFLRPVLQAGAVGEKHIDLPPPPPPEFVTTQLYLTQLAQAMKEMHATNERRELIEHAHDTMHELSEVWSEPDEHAQSGDIAPLVEILIQIRARLRAARQFALADQLRDQLATLGITLEDMPTGTKWKRTSQVQITKDTA